MMRYVLRVFVSAKHMTANVAEGHNGRVVASASTVEHALSDAFERGRAAESVGEVLAMRLKTEAPELGVRGGVHFDAEMNIEKKSVDRGTKVWAVVNAFKNRGVKVFVTDDRNNSEAGVDSKNNKII